MSSLKLQVVEYEKKCEKREDDIANAECYFAGTYLIWINNSYKIIHGDTFIFNGENITNENEAMKMLKKIHKQDLKANSTSELNQIILDNGGKFKIEILDADFYDSEMGYDLVLDELDELYGRLKIQYGDIKKNKLDIYNMKGLIEAFELSLSYEEKRDMDHVLKMINWVL